MSLIIVIVIYSMVFAHPLIFTPIINFIAIVVTVAHSQSLLDFFIQDAHVCALFFQLLKFTLVTV